MTMYQLLLVFGCASVVFGVSNFDDFESALLGPKYCVDGQAVWCQNFSTAIECNAVKHCVQSVWLTQKSCYSGSCGTCESEIDNFRKGISSNVTKEVLKEFLENVCSLTFITELFHKRCEKFVDQYVDEYFNELLDLIKSDIDASQICHILGFCTGFEFKPLKFEDTDAVSFENIVVHLPADFINVDESKKLLGSEKCTWGPSYWCQNITSSKECQSTSNCIVKVWRKQHFNEDNDSVCKICKDMVQQARDQLLSNETQEELREVFEGSCKLMPIKEVRLECIKLADEFVPELTDMLVSEMNPTAVCTIAGLCNSDRIDNLLATQSNSALQVPDLCTNCTAAVTAVERFLQTATPNAIQDKLLRLCGQLSSYSDKCVSIVVSNFLNIHNWLIEEVQPFPVCHLSGMCVTHYHIHTSDDSALQSNVDTVLATANDDLPCDLCKQLVKHLKDVLTTNTTELEFKTILEGICHHTGSFKNECLNIVNTNFQKIYTFLTQELSPDEVCRDVNLCPRGDMVSDENLNLISSYVSSSNKLVTSFPDPPVGKPECRLCQMLIELIKKEMNKPEYKLNMKILLEKVCTWMPHKDRTRCDQFVQKNADRIIDLLTHETNPHAVCSLLQQCAEASSSVHSYPFCPICQDVFHFIQEELEKPDQQKKIEDIVEKVCQVVPKSEEKECQSFITDYSSLILSLLSEELDPSLACPALKFCPSQLAQKDQCVQCQYLLSNFIGQLGGDNSEANVVNSLGSLLPVEHANLTLTAVQLKVTHRDDIIDMMGANFDGQESCLFLHFCDIAMLSQTAKNFADIFPQYNTIESNQLTSLPSIAKPSCALCELMVKLYEDKLTSNATEQEVENDLLKYCSKAHNPELRANCSNFVRKYVPQVMKMLKDDVKAKDVCAFVKLCSLPAVSTDQTSERCEFCEAVVGMLQAVAADPEMVSRSIHAIMELCTHFHASEDRSRCMNIISLVGPQLESVALGIPSWFYCSKIHMCSYGSHLTYKNVCDDPSQWCVDERKAILCDKLTYCRVAAWKANYPSP